MKVIGAVRNADTGSRFGHHVFELIAMIKKVQIEMDARM